MQHLEDQSLESIVHSGIFVNCERNRYMMAQSPILSSYLEIRNKANFLCINRINKLINYSHIESSAG